jgi:hypothetical protein
MKDCAKAGFPFDKDGLIYSVKQIVSESKMQTPFKRNIPGNKWYHSFLKRHPDLSEKKAEYINKARATVTQAKIETWFRETEELLGENIEIFSFRNKFNLSMYVLFKNKNYIFVSLFISLEMCKIYGGHNRKIQCPTVHKW